MRRSLGSAWKASDQPQKSSGHSIDNDNDNNHNNNHNNHKLQKRTGARD